MLPPLNDGDFAEAPDAQMPEDTALIRLRFRPTSMAKRLVSAIIEFVYKDTKQYVLHANVAVDERYLSGCQSAPQSANAKILTVEKDCPAGCPEMLVVAGGEAVMGSPDSEPGRNADEGPLVAKRVGSVAVARYETTVGEFEAFLSASGYVPSALSNQPASFCSAPDNADRWTRSASRNHRSPGFAQAADNPAVCVSWDDAKAYVSWLASKTGKPYRLPSEAEYVFIARAGTRTAYWWGKAADPRRANYEIARGQTSRASRRRHAACFVSAARDPAQLT